MTFTLTHTGTFNIQAQLAMYSNRNRIGRTYCSWFQPCPHIFPTKLTTEVAKYLHVFTTT